MLFKQKKNKFEKVKKIFYQHKNWGRFYVDLFSYHHAWSKPQRSAVDVIKRSVSLCTLWQM